MRALLALLLALILSTPASAQVYTDRDIFEAALGPGLRRLAPPFDVFPADELHIDYTDPHSGIRIQGMGCYASFGSIIGAFTLPCRKDGREYEGELDRSLTVTIPRTIRAVGFDVVAMGWMTRALMPDDEEIFTPLDWFAVADTEELPDVFRGYSHLGGATVRLFAPGGGDTDITAQLRGIVYAATPEPGVLTILATGLLGLGAVGWRRRRRGVA